MSLADLPVEVLQQILNLDNISPAVFELWKSGNRLLISKLARGVTRIDLRSRDEEYVRRWPQCIASFQLDEFSLSAHSELNRASTTALRRNLKRLSNTLRVLSIDVSHAEVVMFADPKTIASLPDDELVPPSKRTKHVETADADLLHTEIWNLDITWPRLESLSVTFPEEEVYGDSHNVTSSLFALLPRTLINFKLTAPFSPSIPSHCDTLPSNLQRLHLTKVIDAEGLHLLPPSITDLGYSLKPEAHLALVQAPSLLPNSKIFPFEGRMEPYRQSHDWIINSGNGRWPYYTDKLKFYNTSAKTLFEVGPQLPAALKRLSLLARSEDGLNVDCLTKLPLGLVQLRLKAIDWNGIETSMWPSTLTCLKHEPHLLPQHYHQLPRSLVIFHSNLRGDKDEDPVDFNALCELGRSLLSGIDKDSWLTHKHKLISDAVRRTGSDSSVVALIEAIESGRHFGLPLGLTSFVCTKITYSDDFTLALPPNIKDLTLKEVDDIKSLSFLPSSITRLKCSFPEAADSAELPQHTALYKLPNIQSLSLRIEAFEAHPFVLRCLPRNLHSLFVHGNFEDDSLALPILSSLPPSLTVLDLHVNWTDLEDWAPLVPRSLRQVYLLCHLPGADFCKLPPQLETLTVGLKNVRLGDFWTLPKTLLSLSCLRSLPRSFNQTPLVDSEFLSLPEIAFLKRECCNLALVPKKLTFEDAKEKLNAFRQTDQDDN